MKNLFFIILMLPLCLLAQVDTAQTLVIDTVLRVYDGDTFYANIANLPPIFGKNIGIRLKGVDTPEMSGVDSCNTALAKAAKIYLDKRLRATCIRIVLKNLERDKYFRIDADVYVNGVNINQEMVTKGFAKLYTGDGPKPKYTCK